MTGNEWAYRVNKYQITTEKKWYKSFQTEADEIKHQMKMFGFTQELSEKTGLMIEEMY